MPNLHGSKAAVWVDSLHGVCINVSGDITGVTFTRTKNNPESTTLGHSTVQRIDGLRDATMDVTAIFNGCTVSGVVSVLDGLHTGSVNTRTQYLPAGSTSGCPVYTGCLRVNSFAQNSPVDGITTVNFSMGMGSGSMTAACIA
jgi:hypothetical protein